MQYWWGVFYFSNTTIMVEETIEEKIQYIIEAYVQPSVAMHGGVVSLDEWDNDNRIAYIFMSGACSGCSSSVATLKMGIENILKHYVPEVALVEGRDDPNSEVSPYY